MEAAFAGALGVRLGGRNHYGDRVEERPPLGGGPLPTPGDVDRAVRLSLLIGAASAALVALARRSSSECPIRARSLDRRSPAGS